jgi:hypothetical protein
MISGIEVRYLALARRLPDGPGGQKTTWGTVLRRRPFAGFGFEGKFGLVSGADGDVLG